MRDIDPRHNPVLMVFPLTEASRLTLPRHMVVTWSRWIESPH
jgi:hypothetical protein